jgi:hypothetical protein
MTIKRTPGAIACALLTICCASATIVPVSQERTVSAGAGVESEGALVATDGHSASAPDFGVFDKTVGFHLAYSDPVYDLGGGADGAATQTSSLTPTLIQAYLLADASASAHDSEFYDTSTGASSIVNFSVDFILPQAGTYRVFDSGDIIDAGDVYMALYQGSTVFTENWGYYQPDDVFDLAPGTYTLYATIDAYASAGPDEFSAGRSQITFGIEELATAVPEPGTAALMLGAAGLALIALWRHRRSDPQPVRARRSS